MTKVAVVIPCHNGARTLRRCLESVLASDYPHFEVVVVDDGSHDNSLLEFETLSDSRLRWLALPRCGGAALARNRGITHTDAELIFFTDVDCLVEPQWISAGVKALASAKTIGVEGPLTYSIHSDSIRYKMPVNPFYHSIPTRALNRPGTDYACGNIAYRRQALLDAGGFRAERFSNGREDTDLGWRLSSQGEIRFCDEMRVVHVSEVWRRDDLWRSAERYEGDVAFFQDHRFFFFRWGPVLHPRFLLLLLFPFFIPVFYPLRSLKDLAFLPAFWIYLAKLRYRIWGGAVRHRAWVV